MSDYIKREDAVNAFRLWVLATHGHRYTNKECAPVFASIPPADVVSKDFHDKTCEAMAKRHTEEIQRLMPKHEVGQELIRCKDCKHRPVKEDVDGDNYGSNLIEPTEGDDRCPCLVDDGWYSWMPEDNFYCGYGEVRDE